MNYEFILIHITLILFSNYEVSLLVHNYSNYELLLSIMKIFIRNIL